MKSERSTSFFESSCAIRLTFSIMTSYSSYLPQAWRGFKSMSKLPRAIFSVACKMVFTGFSADMRRYSAPAPHSAPESAMSIAAVDTAVTAVLPPLASSIAVLENIDTVATSATAKNRMTYSIKENDVRCAPLLARPSPLLPLI